MRKYRSTFNLQNLNPEALVVCLNGIFTLFVAAIHNTAWFTVATALVGSTVIGIYCKQETNWYRTEVDAFYAAQDAQDELAEKARKKRMAELLAENS